MRNFEIFNLFGESSFPSTLGPVNLELSAFLTLRGNVVPKNVFTSFSSARLCVFSFSKWSKHNPKMIRKWSKNNQKISENDLKIIQKISENYSKNIWK